MGEVQRPSRSNFKPVPDFRDGLLSLHCQHVIHDESTQGSTIIEKKDNKACLAAAEFFDHKVVVKTQK
jgi:hypothetical protein